MSRFIRLPDDRIVNADAVSHVSVAFDLKPTGWWAVVITLISGESLTLEALDENGARSMLSQIAYGVDAFQVIEP